MLFMMAATFIHVLLYLINILMLILSAARLATHWFDI